MRLGHLRHQITLQQETQVPDGAGGYALGWTPVATVWGDISPLSGREVFVGHALQGLVTHRVTLRYIPGLTVTIGMSLVSNTRSYKIHAVLNTDARNRWLELLVEDGGGV